MSMSTDEKLVRELLPLLADGELTEHEEALVRRMMEQNPSLKQEGDQYLALKRLTTNIPRAAAPENLEDLVTDHLSKQRGIRSLLAPFFTPPRRMPLEALGVAAVAVLVLFAVVRLVPFSDMQPMDESPMVELAETEDKGGVDEPILAVGEESSPAVSDDIAGGSTDTPSRVPDTPAPTPTIIDTDLFAEEERIMVEPEDEVIAGVTPTAPGEMSVDAEDATHLGAGAPSGMTATAPAAMTAGDTVNRGASATILLVSTSRESEQPIILTIYSKNPYETEMTIMNKAMELGGDVKRMKTEGYRDETLKEKKEASEYIEGDLPPMVYMPPESVEDLLSFIQANYPPVGPELEELDMTEKEDLLQLDFTAPNGEN